VPVQALDYRDPPRRVAYFFEPVRPVGRPLELEQAA
jgi:hypothetical protein